MKLSDNKSIVIRSLIIGFVSLLIGTGLLIYYHFKEQLSTYNYVYILIVFIISILFLVNAIVIQVKNIKKKQISEKGVSCEATYISNETNTTSSKVNYYSIKYTYHIDGIDYVKVSKEEFIWKEILTFKAVKNFPIKVYKDRVILNCDLDGLYKANYDKVVAEEKKYNDACNEVDKIINKK